MMPEAVDDQLALALTDWERLLEVGVNLTTSHADCSAISALFGKRINILQPTVTVTLSTAFSRNLQRLGKLRGRLAIIAIDNVTNSRLVAICEQLIQVMTASHPALTVFYFPQGEKSELLRLKDLEHWAATRLAVHSYFPDAKCALEKLDKVMAYELSQLSPHTVDSDDLTFLKALELGAKIRKGLSCTQHPLIDRIITSKIDALQKSKAITFSLSMSPTESSSSQPNKAKNNSNDKTNESKERVVALQSKLELEATMRTLRRDKKVMAEDKVALTRDRDNLALALKTSEDQRLALQQVLSDEQQAYNSLQSASQQEKDNYRKSSAEVLKVKEQLSEEQEDKKSLAAEIEKLKAEISQPGKASDTSGNMAKVLGESLGGFHGDQRGLEDDIKRISDQLKRAEGTNTAVAMRVHKLAAENAHKKAQLAKSHENLAQATVAPSLRRARASELYPTDGSLMAENARLEKELADAKGTLGVIMSSLSPYSMASPTTLNSSAIAGNFGSQTNGVLPRAKETIRNWDFANANELISKTRTTDTTNNTSEPNTNTLSQAPSGHRKNCTRTTNSRGPENATLSPPTAVGTDDGSFAVPGRAPSPSGSIESEL